MDILKKYQPESSVQLGLHVLSAMDDRTASPQPDAWVQLLDFPSSWGHDEALLLCQHSDREWVVWVPELGEAILHASQFRV